MFILSSFKNYFGKRESQSYKYYLGKSRKVFFRDIKCNRDITFSGNKRK